MEQKPASLVKSAMISGIYLGLISILLSILIWVGGVIESMGIFGGVIIGIMSLVISFILVFIFTKGYRNKVLGGFIGFGEAFKFALIAIAVSIVISMVYTYIFQTFIAPDYMENLMTVMQQKTMDFMASKGVSDEQIDKALEKFEEIPTVWKSLKQTLISGLIGGSIISLIVAAIVRKKEEDVIE